MDDLTLSYHSSIIWSGENHAKILLNANPETLAELKEIRARRTSSEIKNWSVLGKLYLT